MAYTALTEQESNYEDPNIQTPASDAVEFFSVARERRPGRHAKILVGIPALNEEIAIGSITLRSLKYADSLVVIDDGSTDNTSEVAALAGGTVIRHKKNEGKGTSIRDIFSFARTVEADILVLIDGDGQHNPDEMPRLLTPLINEEADMVIGSRFLAGMANNVPFYRRFGQETLTLATNIAAGVKVTDTQSGFRAFTRKAFDCFTFKNHGMAVESEMIVDAARAGLKILEVPIDVRYDVNGSTYHPVKHGFRVLTYILKLIFSQGTRLFKTGRSRAGNPPARETKQDDLS